MTDKKYPRAFLQRQIIKGSSQFVATVTDHKTYAELAFVIILSSPRKWKIHVRHAHTHTHTHTQAHWRVYTPALCANKGGSGGLPPRMSSQEFQFHVIGTYEELLILELIDYNRAYDT